ncbi:MAG: hypothetical protein U7127_25080 [Phormidium sp.]
MYKTLPIRAKFTQQENNFWIDQCKQTNSLINCAVYHVRQRHYSRRENQDNAFITYWQGDELRHKWKTYKCQISYPELDKVLQDNPHYKAVAAQSAQQTLKSVGESINSSINKAARFIINQCLNDRVRNLVIGWNQEQKNCSDMGKRNNQNFVPIPTGRLIERLKQLCPEFGIVLTITEEANTSKASFLDGDSLPKHGEKPEGWKSSGQRIKRGLYRTKLGYLINADCNGAANIIAKVATQLGLCLAEVGRGSLTLPRRVDLRRDLSRSYRKRSEALCL